ncbi:MAG: penicillin-binding protein [Mucilaginibacter polytrichastri]|nr:penicillin-binding protein [Mucilaginibacter polytrichastri]
MFRRVKSPFLRYPLIALYFFILFFCAVELNFLWLFGPTPDMEDIQHPTLAVSSELYSADGKLIGRYFKENRSPVDYKGISPHLVHAIIATEDNRFYKHGGVDFLGFVSSMISTARGDKRGGSTITQQLAKNMFKTRSASSQGLLSHVPVLRTLIYKMKEWITAFKIEHYYSKEQILTMYFNTVPFGNNSYGIKTATKRYFNKNPDKVTAPEAATLIGMLKATSTYNPIRNPDKSMQRRNVVLSQMAKMNFITAGQYKLFSPQKIKLDLGYVDAAASGDSYIRNAVSRWLDKWCEENDYDLYSDGLKIYTTIDSRLQDYALKAMQEKMKALQRRFYNVWGNDIPWRNLNGDVIVDFPEQAARRLYVYPLLKKKFNNSPDSINAWLNKPKKMRVFTWNGDKDTTFSTIDSIKYYAKLLNMGMMTLEPASGKIKVYIGGIDFNHFKYDHVQQAKRQAGSTFKPFAYCAALDNGYAPCDKFIDHPISIAYKENGEDKVWAPKNADFHFSGREMSLRWAMGRSVNSITAQLTEKIGWDKVIDYAHKCGINSPLKSVPSICLGSSDVSVFEMVRAYSTFLNKGMKLDPILVEKITDRKGNVLAEFKPKNERAISEETAWLMTYMLRGGMEEPGGTSQALWEYDLWKKGNEIGGKTGTSSEYVDGWYMGVTKDLVTGVWVGADERSVHFKTSQTGEGSRTALPIYGRFMEQVYADPKSGYTFGRFPKPEVKIDKDYNCPSPRIRMEDPADADSLGTDSTQRGPAPAPVDSLDLHGDFFSTSLPKKRVPVAK